MKKALSFALALLMTFPLLTACGGSSGEGSVDDQYTLIAAYAVAEDPNSQHTNRFDKFKELVEERTDGHVIIDVHPAGELGSEQEYVEMLQNGEIAFASVATSVLSGFTDAFVFADCPFFFRDWDQANAFSQTELARERMDSIEDIGLYCLDMAAVGERNFLTVEDKPINSLADMQGLKLRTMQTQIQVDAVTMLGAQATPLAYNECYQSMQTNVIDGMENEVDTYLAMRFYEVAPNYTQAGWLQLFHVLLGSKEQVDQLPQEYQDIVWEAAHEACLYSTEMGQAYLNGDARAELDAAGVNVIEIEDNSEFRQALEDGGFFDTYAEHIGQDVIDWVNAN